MIEKYIQNLQSKNILFLKISDLRLLIFRKNIDFMFTMSFTKFEMDQV